MILPKIAQKLGGTEALCQRGLVGFQTSQTQHGTLTLGFGVELLGIEREFLHRLIGRFLLGLCIHTHLSGALPGLLACVVLVEAELGLV